MSWKNLIVNRKLTLLISLIYVSIGTLAVCSVYPQDYFYGEWSLFGLLFTFPVTVISFGFRYGDAESLLPIFIIQFLMFVITFLLLRIFIKK
ncbi:hypothetical protein [Flavobacterium solisilvae]|jgi:hypothetical protein|uniref:Uncharacterized protein n=1 Tax=Flavobacterium solisilvae TaxID=1852019 RepID=A0ABX1QUX4_9FLAO|nr:hypothetical protein [Flavobacterium solisilvae]NMH26061.1 hypothetical protein [Flavobacterium solisilvae]